MTHQLKTYRLVDVAVSVFIAITLLIFCMFIYIEFSPIDVIKNKTWILCTAPIKDGKCQTGKPSFHVGDTITIYINSDKVRGASSLFTTNAECKNKAGNFVSYYLSSTETNRAPGHVQTSIDTKIPNIVPTLPTTCRIAYVLEYQIYTFRSFSEYNFSNEFTLTPPATRPVDKPIN